MILLDSPLSIDYEIQVVDFVIIIFLAVSIEFTGGGEIEGEIERGGKRSPNNFKAEDWIGTMSLQPRAEASRWFI